MKPVSYSGSREKEYDDVLTCMSLVIVACLLPLAHHARRNIKFAYIIMYEPSQLS